MQKLYRILDANINRASEGLRVLEDLARFYYQDKALSQKLKELRHRIRKNIMQHMDECLKERDSSGDIGLAISRELKLDDRFDMREVAAANFKRLQEALRTIEENLKLIGQYELSKLYEEYRFVSYAFEKDYFLLRNKKEKMAAFNTGLYCLTSQEHSNGRSNVEVVKAVINAGVKIIQYREKEKKVLDKYNECMEIRKLTNHAGVIFIINDHVDLAMIVKADGVHIGQDDLPVEKVRELVGQDMIIGVSTHCPEQALDAVSRGADYIGVGPIYTTFTKKDVCEPVGLSYLEYVVNNLNIPFVAIGGIKEHNLEEVMEKGAGCVAIVTGIVGAHDIEEKIRCITSKMKISKMKI